MQSGPRLVASIDKAAHRSSEVLVKRDSTVHLSTWLTNSEKNNNKKTTTTKKQQQQQKKKKKNKDDFLV